MINVSNNSKSKSFVRFQVLCGILAVAAAVIFPQIVHSLGSALGISNTIGEIILPMHLPVILSGALAGPLVGFITGLFAPLISMLISGMPSTIILPFMIVELGVYGFTAGLIKKYNIPSLFKVLLVQAAGRIMRLFATIIAFYGLGFTSVGVFSVFTAVYKGALGILLQLILVGFSFHYIKNLNL